MTDQRRLFGVSRPAEGRRIRRVDFWWPRGHGRTWLRFAEGRRLRHLSLWFGQSREDVDAFRRPRYTLSIDFYRERQ